MRILCVVIILLIVNACGAPSIPQWKDTSFRQLENYKNNFLTDKEAATDPHFAKAKQAVSSSNDLHLLAIVYLTKYALHAAALEDFDDSEFLKIDKLEHNAAHRAYYDLLRGNFSAVDPVLLPVSYRKLLPALAGNDVTAAHREITAIGDPLSCLIASGLAIKYLSADFSILQLAIKTSAKEGWRRPLWAYLSKLQKYYYDRQEITKAQSVQERLDLLRK